MQTDGTRVTIADVARAVGVAPSTVSHALSRKRPIGPDVRRRVAEAVKELGYRPNFAARSLATRKTGMIGLLIADLSDPMTCRAAEALERELAERGHKILAAMTGTDRKRRLACLREFADGVVEGAVNLDPGLGDAQLRRGLGDVPGITFMCPGPDAPFRVDYAEGVRQALEHLWSLGHEGIGLMTGPPDGPGTKNRTDAYERLYREREAHWSVNWIAHGDPRPASGRESGRLLIEAGCTAIVTAGDVQGIGAVNAAREAGLDVPGEVSVVGFGDSVPADMVWPGLTTLRLPLDDLARWTVESLLDRIAGRPAEAQRVVRPELVLRGSTARCTRPARPPRSEWSVETD